MSSMAKTAREAMKAKAQRLGSSRPLEKVDSSSWTPAELLNADVKTGLRPVSRRAFKKGGKVMGDCSAPRADRKPRKSGGKAITADSLINRNVKEANEDRDGIKHIGGMKKGGKVKRKGRDEGGKVDEIGEFIKKDTTPAVAGKGPLTKEQAGIKTGGGTADERAANAAAFDKEQQEYQRNLPQNRKSGGRTKKAVGGPQLGAAKMMQDAANTAGVPSSTMQFSPVKGGKFANSVGFKKGGKVHEDVAADKALIKKMVKASARTGKADGGASDDEVAQYRKDMDDYRKKHAEWYHAPYDKNKKAPQQPESPAMKRAFKQIEETFSPERMRQMAVEHFASRMKDPAFAAGRTKRGMDPDVNPYEDKSKTLAQVKRADDSAQEKGYAASQKQQDQGDDELPGSVKVGKAMANLFGGKRAARKEGGGVFSGPGYPGKIPGVVPGGRTARATGGKTKGKGKTNINIVIAAGKTPGADAGLLPPGAMPKSPGGIPIPLGPQGGPPQGAAPMPMPVPMPMPAPAGGPAGGPPMARKAGGRISKVASSYKDMEAGSAGGEGRLQKTDIAKKHKGAPTFKKGGKVYRSYKDMDAGSASGLGRLEKTEIAARKG